VASIFQATPPFLMVALEPLVAGLSTDAIAGADLCSRVQAAPIIGNEAFTLFHGCGLQPGHRPTSPTKGWPCSLEEVSPIIPVYSVTYLSGLYRLSA
jgi:hypothetical protein